LRYQLEWRCPRPENNLIDRHARLCSPIQRQILAVSMDSAEEKEQRAHVEEEGEEEEGEEEEPQVEEVGEQVEAEEAEV
jgi:hypothetical protein